MHQTTLFYTKINECDVNGNFYVVDHSTKGTFLNGKILEHQNIPNLLRHQDVITFGGSEVELEFQIEVVEQKNTLGCLEGNKRKRSIGTTDEENRKGGRSCTKCSDETNVNQAVQSL